jgi:hypothetical protein
VSSFVQSVLLLLLTAGLTGVGAPFILRRVDERRDRRQAQLNEERLRAQKVFEADLARQSKTIDAQVVLLETLSKMAWDFQMMALEPAYYALSREEARFRDAAQRYDVESWACLGQVRAEISKARRLVSPGLFEQLLSYYYDTLIALDMETSDLIRKSLVGKWPASVESSSEGWRRNHTAIFTGLAQKNDELLGNLAEEFRLTKPSAEPSSDGSSKTH